MTALKSLSAWSAANLAHLAATDVFGIRILVMSHRDCDRMHRTLACGRTSGIDVHPPAWERTVRCRNWLDDRPQWAKLLVLQSD